MVVTYVCLCVCVCAHLKNGSVAIIEKESITARVGSHH